MVETLLMLLFQEMVEQAQHLLQVLDLVVLQVVDVLSELQVVNLEA